MRTTARRRPSVARATLSGLAPAALLAPAAFLVHQLRYLLAFGGGAGAVLARTGHSYLHSVGPWLALLVAMAVGGFLRALGRACAGRTSTTGFTVSFAGLWLACSISLVAIFAGQELLEGVIATGHPAGLGAVFAYGGWWALPIAACIGLVLAACLHGARWVLREIEERHAGRAHLPRPVRRLVPPLFSAPLPRPPLVAGWSDRGPPRILAISGHRAGIAAVV